MFRFLHQQRPVGGLRCHKSPFASSYHSHTALIQLISPPAGASAQTWATVYSLMAGLTPMLTFLCVAGCHLCSASPVLHSAQVVQAGQNVSLTCNLTSSMEVTWYLLRSDKLLPLLTVSSGKIGGDEVMFHTADSRFKSSGALERGPVSLEILGVEEQDAGLYFCIWRCPGYSCVNRGIYLMMNGKPAVCCCKSWRRGSSARVTEEVALHYSSLRHADKPRPSGRGGIRLVEEDVIYSTVTIHNNPKGSHDHR
uniref:uncharacterized protein LOC109952473 isoform X2 n=1 Tax=Monopterus albus TaxID=43700 RepID=UPI0009B4BDF7|nr:uncharacterized protein LOC109952473 isoform X2 [Monopterus albus]